MHIQGNETLQTPETRKDFLGSAQRKRHKKLNQTNASYIKVDEIGASTFGMVGPHTQQS